MAIIEHEAAGVHVRECGSGFPLLVLHPGPGLDGSVFFPEIELLAGRGIRVLALDLPGNGASETPPADDLTFAGQARGVIAAADALGLDTYGVLGHSFGGFVALQHAVDAPDRLACLIASCTDASETADWPEEDPVDQLPPPIAKAVDAAFHAEEEATTPDELRAAWMGQVPLFAAEPEGPAVERVRQRFAGCRYRTDTLGTDWGELETLDGLARLDAPVLAIVGSNDLVRPPVASRRIADRARNGTYVELAGTGHFPFIDDPDRYWGAVGDWLSANAPAN